MVETERERERSMATAAAVKRKMESEGSQIWRRPKLSPGDGDFSLPADMLSRLPNEIVHSILYRLTLRDGVRLTAISSRWKDLLVSYLLHGKRRLCFDWENMFDDSDSDSDSSKEKCPCRRGDPAVPRRKKFVKAVQQFLDFFARCILCHGSSSKVRLFEVKFCYRLGFGIEICRWVDFAIRDLKVEELRLCLLCRHSDSRNQRPYKEEDCCLSCFHTRFVFSSYSWQRVTSLLDYSLRSLHLSSCNLAPEFFSNKQRFGSRRIRTLCLTHVPLRNYDVGTMLSCLVNVETLDFFHCSLPKRLTLNSMHALQSLGISFCPGIKELHMGDNINLTTFTFRNTNFKWDFVGAPKLRNWIANIGAGGASSFFTNAWRNLPFLGVVSLASKADLFRCLPNHSPTFCSVTDLSLHFEGSVRFDVFKMASLLKAYPNLSRLSLRVDHSEDVDPKKVQSCDHVIEHLKEVELLNFRATSSVVVFTVYLLRHAISLKRVTFQTCTPPNDLHMCDNGDLLKISALREFAKGVDLIVIS